MANCAEAMRGREEKIFKKEINKQKHSQNPNMLVDIKKIMLSCTK